MGLQGHLESKDDCSWRCERIFFFFFRLCEGIIRPILEALGKVLEVNLNAHVVLGGVLSKHLLCQLSPVGGFC